MPGTRRMVTAAIVVVGAWAAVAVAQDTAEENLAGVFALSWFAGSWSTRGEETEAEETWMPPKAGLLLGIHRSVTPSGRVVFEYLRIEERPDGVFYMASPMGREATPFRLTELTEDRAVFENPEHDFPKRIIYRREGADTLHARVEGEHDGETGYLEWTFSRQSVSTE